MPYSSGAGKDWIVDKVKRHYGIAEVLDVGAGSGTYVKLLRRLVLPDSYWTAIEIWEPYVAQFRLNTLYDKVIVGHALEVTGLEDTVFDLAIFGDVLEHTSPANAIWMVERFKWKYAIISIPVMEYEEHVATWSVTDVHNVWGDIITDETVVDGIGVFWLERK